MVTDTHANLETPERSAHLTRVLEHIESRDPAFVVNCGDVTDVATTAEFELYESCVPDDLRARLRHVPGNHEEQWNIDAFEAYDHHFGPTYYSFDAAGVHVVTVDPIALKDWSWHFGPEQLRWLERALRSVASGVPIIVVTHFPMGLDWHFAYDGEEFLRTIENHRVRGIFCGHIHRTSASRFNGLTQVTGRSFKNGPFYYWVERVDGASGPALEVTEVLVPADAEPTHQLLATMPIDDVGPGGNLGPLDVSTRTAGNALSVRVETPADAPTAEVMARLHPHGDTVQDWTYLDGAGRRWIGNLDIAGLPPGPHKIEVRAVDDADGVYDSSASFDIPTREVRVAWTAQTAGSVRGALAQRDGLVVAATTEGVVEAYRPTTDAANSQWRTELGPVYRGPVFTPDGGGILVPSADHHLYALDATDGTERWRTDLGAPVMGEVTFAEVDGQTRVFVPVGRELICLELGGDVLWAADLHGACRGAAACDGERVYIASGDGRAYAMDARTGAERWSTDLTGRPSAYGSLIYGPWGSHVRLLPNQTVLFATFTDAQALDAASGERRWTSSAQTLQRQVLYTPPTVTTYGILVFDGRDGIAHLLDIESGESTWSADALPESFGAGPLPAGQDADEPVFWMVGKTGRVVKIDLANRSVRPVLQVSRSFTESTAALVGSGAERVLVTGGEDARLRGIVGLDDVPG